MGGRGSISASFSSNTLRYTPEQEQAIVDYVLDKNGEVGKVRAVQQGKNLGSEQEKYQVMGEIIEDFILQNKGEYDKIYRGIKAPIGDHEKYVEGFEFDQLGTSSWSGTDGQALRYANRRDITGEPIMFISHKGKNAATIAKFQSEKLDMNEDEWLVSRNQKFRVLSDAYDVYIPGYGKVWIVDAEEVR